MYVVVPFTGKLYVWCPSSAERQLLMRMPLRYKVCRQAHPLASDGMLRKDTSMFMWLLPGLMASAPILLQNSISRIGCIVPLLEVIIIFGMK